MSSNTSQVHDLLQSALNGLELSQRGVAAMGAHGCGCWIGVFMVKIKSCRLCYWVNNYDIASTESLSHDAVVCPWCRDQLQRIVHVARLRRYVRDLGTRLLAKPKCAPNTQRALASTLLAIRLDLVADTRLPALIKIPRGNRLSIANIPIFACLDGRGRMVHSKRKRVHDENPAEAESASRRTTRHSHPTTLLTEHDAEPEKPLRSRRVRSDTHDAPTEPTLPIPAAAPITKTYVTRPRDTTAKTSDPDSAAPRPKVPHATIRRTKRHSATADHVDAADHASTGQQAEGKENLQPAHLADAKGAAAASSPHQRSPVLPHPRPRAPGPSAPASPDNPAAACRGSTSSIITPKRRLSIQPQKPPPTPRSDRNIDRVVLGDISFRAWYPSYYGKDVLGDASVTSGGKANPGGGGAKIGGGKKDKEVLLDRLFVCPSCFKYSKEEPKWRKHINACLPKAWVPGAKIYVHPKESRTPQSTSGSDARRKSKPKKEDGSAPVTEGEWSVWEVDGENEPVSQKMPRFTCMRY